MWATPFVRSAFLVSLLGVTFAASPASAETAAFAWDAPPGCPDRERAMVELERVVGPDAASNPVLALLSVRIVPEAEKYRLVIVVRDPTGAESERTLVANDCEQASQAAVAIVATTLGVTRAPQAAGAATSPVGQTQTTKAPPNEARPEVSRPPLARAERRLAGSLGASFGVELGALPHAAGFAELSGGIGSRHFGVTLALGATLPAQATLEGTTVGADLTLLRATFAGCYRSGRRAWALGACLGAEAGSLHAAGFGLQSSHPGSAFWSAAVLSGTGEWRLSKRVGVRAGGAAVVPFRQVEIVVAPAPPIHESAVIGARFWLGIGFIFD